jgi:hypothetical protein
MTRRAAIIVAAGAVIVVGAAVIVWAASDDGDQPNRPLTGTTATGATYRLTMRRPTAADDPATQWCAQLTYRRRRAPRSIYTICDDPELAKAPVTAGTVAACPRDLVIYGFAEPMVNSVQITRKAGEPIQARFSALPPAVADAVDGRAFGVAADARDRITSIQATSSDGNVLATVTPGPGSACHDRQIGFGPVDVDR